MGPAASDHDNGATIPDRQHGWEGSGEGLPAEEWNGDAPSGSLIRKHADRLSLLERYLKDEEGVSLRYDDLPAFGALSVKQVLEIDVIQRTHHGDERNASDGTRKWEELPVADMGGDEYAAA